MSRGANIEEVLLRSQVIGYTWGSANALSHLALAVLQPGDVPRATDLFTQGLRLLRALGEVVGMAECLEGLPLTAAEADPARLVRQMGLTDL